MAIDDVVNETIERVKQLFTSEVEEYYKQNGVPLDKNEILISNAYMNSDEPDEREIILETESYALFYEGSFLKQFRKKLVEKEHMDFLLKPNPSKLKSKDDVIKILKRNINESTGIDYEHLSFDSDEGILNIIAEFPSYVIGSKAIVIKKLAKSTGWRIAVDDMQLDRGTKIETRSPVGTIKDSLTTKSLKNLEYFRENILSNTPSSKKIERTYLNLRGLGGCAEVGRSSMYLETSKDNAILFDCGASFTKNTSMQFPLLELVDLNRVKYIVLSHVHSDHLCGIPLLYRMNFKGKILTQKYNKEFMELICSDFMEVYKMINGKLPYEKADVENMMKNVVGLDYDKEYPLNKNCNLYLLNAGHILGSAMPFVNHSGNDAEQSILYTGDFSTRDCNILKGAIFPENARHIISESTYGDTLNETSFENQKKEFLGDISRTLERKGTVIIPSFAVGRSQDVLISILESSIGCKIYLDGMIRKTNRIVQDILLNNSDDKYLLNESKADIIKDPRVSYLETRDREALLKNREPKIIITTSGMGEGLAELYQQNYISEPQHLVAYVGFLSMGSKGRQIISILNDSRIQKKEVLFSEAVKKEIRSSVKQYKFSAHADGLELRGLVRQNPENIILVHGDYEAISNLKEGLLHDYESFGKSSSSPKIRYLSLGDSIFLKKPTIGNSE